MVDPGFPIGGVDPLGGRRPPTRTLFSENVKILGPVGGVHHNFLYVRPPMLWYPLLGTGVTLLPLSFIDQDGFIMKYALLLLDPQSHLWLRNRTFSPMRQE